MGFQSAAVAQTPLLLGKYGGRYSSVQCLVLCSGSFSGLQGQRLCICGISGTKYIAHRLREASSWQACTLAQQRQGINTLFWSCSKKTFGDFCASIGEWRISDSFMIIRLLAEGLFSGAGVISVRFARHGPTSLG